jgi:SAM-dependent methyltransferase
MTMTALSSQIKPDASQISAWLNEAHQWHRIAGDRRLSLAKLKQARQKVAGLLQRILKANPVHIAALRLRYHSEVSAGQSFAALTTIQQLVRLEPNNASTVMDYAQTALKTDKFVEAEAAFQRVLNRQKDRADAYCGIAEARLGQKDFVGAYLRASSLYARGYRSSALYLVLEASTRQLKCDAYLPEADALFVDFLLDSHINPESLSPMLGSLIRHKYSLDDPDASIDIAACACDPLLINALLLTTLQDSAIESFVALLRQHIFLTACASGELEESMQTLAIALGVYAQRTDYLCPAATDETTILDALHQHIEYSIDEGASSDELVAALLLVSLYRPLYPERYSFKLLRWDLDAWPTRVQSVLKLNLYDYANEHALRHELNHTTQEREAELISQTAKTAFPKWSLPELVQEWRLLESADSHLEEVAEPHILILGCGSGKRAIALAQYYPNAIILAIDDNAHDLAYASRQATEIGCDNIEFSFGLWKKQLPLLTNRFDLIECTAFIPNPGKLWCEQLKRMTSECGIIHLRDNNTFLPDTADHATMVLPQSAAYAEWRSMTLKASDKQLSFETRNALFNREGARRLMRPDAQSTKDLAETLQRFGITLVNNTQQKELLAAADTDQEVHSRAM